MKQQQLTFEKGITNVPSDAICSDNALSDSTNMIYRDGEHHVIQAPKEEITGIAGNLIFVHKYGEESRYIVNNNGAVSWGLNTNGTYSHQGDLFSMTSSSDVRSVTALGKTLIFSTTNGLYYLIAKPSTYTFYDKIPEPIFDVKTTLLRSGKTNRVMSSGEYGDMIDFSGSRPIVPDNRQSAFDDFVIGLYSKNQNLVKEEKGFCEPFFVRVALEMYDGTYTHISNPILLLPAVHQNGYFWKFSSQINCTTYFEWLDISQSQDYTDFSDLIKNVTLFITEGISLYNTTKAEQIIEVLNEGDLYSDYVTTTSYVRDTVTSNMGDVYRMIALRDVVGIEDDLKTASIYYKLCELGIKPTGTIPAEEKISSDRLKTITAQERLVYDEYYSYCKIIPSYISVYNARLNIANIERGFFEGFKLFVPFGDYLAANRTRDVDIYVRIKTDSGNRVVKRVASGYGWQEFIWFYYPDPRADWVTISYTTNQDVRVTVLDVALSEHPGLNGAYYFYGLPTSNNVPIPSSTTTLGPSTDTTPETLGSQMATSEVNNPFVFKAEGYNTIGTGKIISMASQTQALSQGQFGQYPLLVFTTEGIWAMSLDNTGLFVAIHPMSREVALENNPAITPVDGAVFFVSKKGLMVVEGNRVTCVSEQLKGRSTIDYSEYFSECYIAYDYRDSLLWIFSRATVPNSGLILPDGGLAYSMKSGAFALVDLTFQPARVVNNYPDYLIQDANNHVYTLYGRDAAVSDSGTYSASMKSRPLKLENGLALKRVVQVMHIKDLVGVGASMMFSMEGSNDLKNWHQLTSLRSTPWKYYRFGYTFSGLKASSTFAGSVIKTEEVRTEKMR